MVVFSRRRILYGVCLIVINRFQLFRLEIHRIFDLDFLGVGRFMFNKLQRVLWRIHSKINTLVKSGYEISMSSSNKKNSEEVGFTESVAGLNSRCDKDMSPVIIWTFRRTGGTNIARKIFEASVFSSAEHEPFNISREYGYIHKRWKKNRNIEELEFLLDEILSQKLCIKHCLELMPEELNIALIDVSIKYGYKHVFLYREEARDRLLSLNFALKTGVWGRLSKKNGFDECVFNEEIDINQLIDHEDYSRKGMRSVYNYILKKGLSPFVMSFESLYCDEYVNSKLLLGELFSFLLADDYYLSEAFLSETLKRGSQGTKEDYLRFENSAKFLDEVDKIGRFDLTITQ